MLEQLCMLRDFETRSVCSENKTGEKGMGGRTSARDGVAAHAPRGIWAMAGRPTLMSASRAEKRGRS